MGHPSSEKNAIRSSFNSNGKSLANVRKIREKYCTDKSLTALCDQDEARKTLEMGE